MSEFYELRYPFTSAINFYSGGYWLDPRALHLAVGHLSVFLGLFFFAVRHFIQLPFVIASAAITTSFMVNPSLSFAGLFVSDWLIMAAAFLGIFTLVNLCLPKVGWWSLVFLAFVAVHSLLVFKIYDLGDSALFDQRILLVLRPFAVLLAVGFLFKGFQNVPQSKKIFKQMLYLMLFISLFTYALQFGVYKSGIIPFGTFHSAGFGGGVRFGGLANEGGHLAKLTFPLLVIALLTAQKLADFVLVVFFVCAFLVNPSASGYAFFTSFVLFSLFFAVCYSLKFARWKSFVAVSSAALIAVFSALILTMNSTVISGIYSKISDAMMVMFDPKMDIYGRSPASAFRILSEFPLGVGYAGSSQRNLAPQILKVGFGESNLGLNVLFESLSIFALVPVVLLLLLSVNHTRRVMSSSRLGFFRAGLWASVPWTICSVLILDVLFILPQLWTLFFLVFGAPIGVFTSPISRQLKCDKGRLLGQ